jgi:chemotaxis protein histidine kinase CheA
MMKITQSPPVAADGSEVAGNQGSAPSDPTPNAEPHEARIAQADAALAQLSQRFASWMDDEFGRLEALCSELHQHGMSRTSAKQLFVAAHDIKGQAATLGHPLIEAVAKNLCRLLESARDQTRIPPALVDRHVDAMRSIVRANTRPRDRRVSHPRECGSACRARSDRQSAARAQRPLSCDALVKTGGGRVLADQFLAEQARFLTGGFRPEAPQ